MTEVVNGGISFGCALAMIEFICWWLLSAVIGTVLILFIDTVYMAITGKSKLGR